MKPYEKRARELWARYAARYNPGMSWEKLADRGRTVWMAEARRRSRVLP